MIHRASLVLHILLALALTAFTLEQFFAPTSWWIDINKIFVPDAILGGPSPVVAIDDVIRRPFIGRFYFEIRKVGPALPHGQTPDLSRFTYFCSGYGEISFRPGSDPFANASLEGLTRNKCPSFIAGSYYAQALLVWNDFLTSRSITSYSNVWTVAPPPPAPKIIVQQPVTVVNQAVTRTIVVAPRPRCQPSLIPPVVCPPERGFRARGAPRRVR